MDPELRPGSRHGAEAPRGPRGPQGPYSLYGPGGPHGPDGGHDGPEPFELPGGYTLFAPRVSSQASGYLSEVAPGILRGGANDFPLVEGIPYLRTESTRPGLEDIRERACAHLRAGDERAALRLLLRDQDRFSPTPPPTEAAVDELLDRRDELTLREAMALLNYGAVADYFAHRWSSPTFQSGLALLERACLPSRPVLEVGCGIGHFLRHLEGQGYATVGADLVFSKLWLARHFLGVRGPLMCMDVEQERSAVFAPLEDDGVPAPHTVFCHDAFYFFEDKSAVFSKLKLLSHGGTVVLGHVHTRTDAHEAGFAERLTDYRALLPAGAHLIDDASLACSYVNEDSDEEGATEESTAIALIAGRQLRNPSSFLPPRERLRVNPLLTAAGMAYPSEGYRREFEADSEDLGRTSLPAFAKTRRVQALVTGGLALADLGDEEVESLYRHRVLLDLPPRW